MANTFTVIIRTTNGTLTHLGLSQYAVNELISKYSDILDSRATVKRVQFVVTEEE